MTSTATLKYGPKILITRGITREEGGGTEGRRLTVFGKWTIN